MKTLAPWTPLMTHLVIWSAALIVALAVYGLTGYSNRRRARRERRAWQRRLLGWYDGDPGDLVIRDLKAEARVRRELEGHRHRLGCFHGTTPCPSRDDEGEAFDGPGAA